MIDAPSISKFTAFVQLKDFRDKTKQEYVRYVRRLGDHYQCDPATLTEEQVCAYYLELRQIRKFTPPPHPRLHRAGQCHPLGI